MWIVCSKSNELTHLSADCSALWFMHYYKCVTFRESCSFSRSLNQSFIRSISFIHLSIGNNKIIYKYIHIFYLSHSNRVSHNKRVLYALARFSLELLLVESVGDIIVVQYSEKRASTAPITTTMTTTITATTAAAAQMTSTTQTAHCVGLFLSIRMLRCLYVFTVYTVYALNILQRHGKYFHLMCQIYFYCCIYIFTS